ncbi:hypothetical protein ABT160_06290 [Streptomyces sp. NPDC001941]|uniref:trypsin-like serine peptidase n=1 Tax=Streptomyces sp. NPDC001941 TaxID=3154659 RepID=UPI00332F920A
MQIPALALAAAALSAALLPTGPATPAASLAAPPAAPSAAVAPTAADQAAVRAYWTPRRMREAVEESGGPLFEGTPDGRPWRGDPGAVRGIGRLFMVLPDDRKATCTAAVVSAPSKDVVATAGHCVHLKAVGGFMKALMFVPGFEDGRAPYGQYPATAVGIAPEWAAREDHGADYAFLGLAGDERGRHVQDVVGGRPAAFGPVPGPKTALGYPFAPPYDGRTLQFCAGATTAVADPRMPGGEQLRPCRMTNGASGGPWYAQTASGATVQAGVTSSRPGTADYADAAWGAMFDGRARRLYDYVAKTPTVKAKKSPISTGQ